MIESIPTMRRRRRRRTRSARTYSIAHLLNRQPKTLSKDPNYATMMRHYFANERLQRIRVSRRCYTLLNNARIAPENLHNFYRTYRLPADPFFPLFFAAKRRYLAERERIREERRRYILATMRSLPEPTLSMIRYLGHLERYYNPAGLSPVWQAELFPGSKKKADSYTRLDETTWLLVFRRHLALLEARYRGLSDVVAERALASWVLGLYETLDPERLPPQRPDRNAVTRAYRRLSLLHHPDRGGNQAMFIEIKRARDVLVGEER